MRLNFFSLHAASQPAFRRFLGHPCAHSFPLLIKGGATIGGVSSDKGDHFKMTRCDGISCIASQVFSAWPNFPGG